MLDLLAVGSVVPRKGYDILVAALAAIPDLAWRLVIAGDRERSPQTARALDAQIARLGLAGRITFAGAVAPQRLMQLYAAADLFVLPSRFEGYGMAYAEAIAHGVPVVGTRAGAIPQTVPAGAGVLVPPDDVDALANVLRRLIASPSERERLAAGARAAAATFPSWQDIGRAVCGRAGAGCGTGAGRSMSGFSAQWLALREPYDLRARNATVLAAVAAAFADQPAVAVVDLACGAGASLRAIGPHLPPRQSWRLVDNDLGLLARTVALAQPPRSQRAGAGGRSRPRSRARARRTA